MYPNPRKLFRVPQARLLPPNQRSTRVAAHQVLQRPHYASVVKLDLGD